MLQQRLGNSDCVQNIILQPSDESERTAYPSTGPTRL